MPGMAQLKEVKRLHDARVCAGTQVTDAGLAQLKEMKGLPTLHGD